MRMRPALACRRLIDGSLHQSPSHTLPFICTARHCGPIPPARLMWLLMGLILLAQLTSASTGLMYSIANVTLSPSSAAGCCSGPSRVGVVLRRGGPQQGLHCDETESQGGFYRLELRVGTLPCCFNPELLQLTAACHLTLATRERQSSKNKPGIFVEGVKRRDIDNGYGERKGPLRTASSHGHASCAITAMQPVHIGPPSAKIRHPGDPTEFLCRCGQWHQATCWQVLAAGCSPGTIASHCPGILAATSFAIL
ncbi:hypothetical protein MHYP_G00012010 [Metynnis hypsauchen]